jgi:hypothetical protein
MRRFGKKQVAIAAGTGALVLAGSGIGFAYFTSSGGGSGSAVVGSPTTAISVAQDAGTPASGLYPGANAKAVAFTITNPSPGYSYVNTVTVSIPTTTDGSSNTVVENASDGSAVAGCLASWFQVNNAVQSVHQSIPGTDAGGNTYDDSGSTASVQMLNVNLDQGACKGVTLKLNFTSN